MQNEDWETECYLCGKPKVRPKPAEKSPTVKNGPKAEEPAMPVLQTAPQTDDVLPVFNMQTQPVEDVQSFDFSFIQKPQEDADEITKDNEDISELPLQNNVCEEAVKTEFLQDAPQTDIFAQELKNAPFAPEMPQAEEPALAAEPPSAPSAFAWTQLYEDMHSAQSPNPDSVPENRSSFTTAFNSFLDGIDQGTASLDDLIRKHEEQQKAQQEQERDNRRIKKETRQAEKNAKRAQHKQKRSQLASEAVIAQCKAMRILFFISAAAVFLCFALAVFVKFANGGIADIAFAADEILYAFEKHLSEAFEYNLPNMLDRFRDALQ